MREIDRWRSAPTAGRRFEYRAVEVDGEFALEWKLADEPDSAFQPSVRGDGHAVARRMADLLREEHERKNLLTMKARSV